LEIFNGRNFFSLFLKNIMGFSLKTHSIDSFSHFPHLVHAFSPRGFERERGVREELLLGRKADPRSSQQHRQWFLENLNIDSKELFLVKQVHGDRVFVLDDPQKSADQVEQEAADALITHLTEKPIAVLTADCVPVILYDPERHVVGVIHAGRKGTQMRVVSKTISILSNIYGCRPKNVVMALGPAIGGCCYEVEDPCIAPFREHYQGWKEFVTANSHNRFMLDLLKANEADGLGAGILKDNIHRSGECTSCNNDRWFSYRREGTTGRIISLAMLREKPARV
jgi:purine-nucleoside/S-methyl-5'-thioadenosine phosphorylase / adenosine deaminase